MCLVKKWHEFSNSGLLSRCYDVIIGNMEGFVTLLFIKVEGQNLADWGTLMCTFPIFKIEGFYDVIMMS